MRITLVAALAVGAVFATSTAGQAQTNYYWTGSGGSWTSQSNWLWGLHGGHPNASTDTAYFSLFTSTSKTITLDAPITIGGLTFSNSQTGAITLAPGAGGSLTLFSTNADPASLSVGASSGDHLITANMNLGGTANHEWNIGANRTFTVNGNIGGARGLTKIGTGTLLLTGTNTYSGPTTVSAGTLRGRGSIASAVTVAVGATIAAGTAAATPNLTLGNGLALSGKYQVTLFSISTASRINVTAGAVNLNSATLEMVLGSGVTVASMRTAGPQSFTIIDAANNQLFGSFTSNNFTSLGFAASEWNINYNAGTGNATLNFTPIPEPTTILGLAAGTLVSGAALRRRLRKPQPLPI